VPSRREPHDRPAPRQAHTELLIDRSGRPTPGKSSQDREHEAPNDGPVSSNTFRGRLRLTHRHMFSPGPWITRRSARIILVDGRCCDALAGAHLEAGARNHDKCSAPVALCKRSLRNGTADTAPGNGQRCRSQAEALEQGTRGRQGLFSEVELGRAQRRPKQYGTLGSTWTTSSNRYRLTARLLVNSLGHRGLWSSPRSSDAGRLSIEYNGRLFRLWSIDVTD
jgi:hypothetical protein